MRRNSKGFAYHAKASGGQLSAYEEVKNRDYTRNFGQNTDAILLDFRRQNYFLLRNETFQTKQDHEFSPEQVSEIQLKLKKITNSESLAHLIQAIGGQAFQAPLSVLEFLNFRYENEAISAVAKFDLSFYFHHKGELNYINLNFCYGFKSVLKDRNYILDERAEELVEISDRECQALSAVMNTLSNDVQKYLGLAINSLNEDNLDQTPAEKTARNISLIFKSYEKMNLSDFLENIEKEIRLLMHEYILLRRHNLLWESEFKEEVSALENLRKMRFKPILGGADHMGFLKEWAHLEVVYAKDAKAYEDIKLQWLKAHDLNDFLIIRCPLKNRWVAYKISSEKKLEPWRDIERELYQNFLRDVTPKNVGEFNFSILRDLLDENSRAICQMDLVLCNNSSEIQNLYVEKNPPIRSQLELKHDLSLKTRELTIRKMFHEGFQRELRMSCVIRDQIPGRHIKKSLKILIAHFLDPNAATDLNDGEFLQWTYISINHYFENLKRTAFISDLRVSDYYQLQLFPKIEQERRHILAKRRKRIYRILKLDLNDEEISRYSRNLVREAYKVFQSACGAYSSISQAVHALYCDSLSASLDNLADNDELIYRLAYMKSRDPVNAAFLEILLCEAVHVKISLENNWSLRESSVFRKKSAGYLEQAKIIFEEVTEKIETQISVQKEEREKGMTACDEMRQKSEEFLKSKPRTENHVVGRALQNLSKELSSVVKAHYQNHYFRLEESPEVARDKTQFIEKINKTIDISLTKELALNQYEDLRERIKTHALNLFLTIFTLGIFPLTRKFVLKKPAFFSPLKQEISEEARVILSL